MQLRVAFIWLLEKSFIFIIMFKQSLLHIEIKIKFL